MAEPNRRRVLAAFWARVAGFGALLAVVLAYACYVLTPKHDYGICSMLNLYRQPRNSVDVLVVGTSIAYAGVNTNVLWSEYGIASYDLCSAEQPFWISYYAIREALKTQHPQLILLDAKPAIYTDDYSSRSRTILSTYGILSPGNRLAAIAASVEDPALARSLFLALPEVHNHYSAVTWESFLLPPTNGGRGATWKGYIEEDAVEAHTRPTFVWSSVRRPINPREEEYVRRIFELARDEGVEVMLIGLPNPDYAYDHLYFNSLWSIAEEYGFSGINYNDPSLRFGLMYGSDFADWQHLNVKGSMNFTRRLGEDLLAAYDLPDRRGDPGYASYDACAERWYALYPTFESVQQEGSDGL